MFKLLLVQGRQILLVRPSRAVNSRISIPPPFSVMNGRVIPFAELFKKEIVIKDFLTHTTTTYMLGVPTVPLLEVRIGFVH